MPVEFRTTEAVSIIFDKDILAVTPITNVTS